VKLKFDPVHKYVARFDIAAHTKTLAGTRDYRVNVQRHAKILYWLAVNHSIGGSLRRGFQLPIILVPSAAPKAMSVRRDEPRHITVLPGGGSLARAR
jgi:hypothetical protein